MKILEIEKLNMVFTTRGLNGAERVHVLRDIDLDIEQGEIMALVGESGCGKTTLGKIITGLLDATSGTVKFNGNDIVSCSKKDKKEYRKSVQFIQQDSYAALNPVKKIYSSLYTPIKANNRKLSGPEIDALIVKYLEMVGLTPASLFLEKYPHQLSGGQRQRVLIARVLSLNPKLIVADEPISMIDVSLRLSILQLLSELNQKLGLTIVYITHDLSTVKYVVGEGRMAVMYLGEIVEFGKVKEVISQPVHPYTQALISSVSIPDPVIERAKPMIRLKSMEIPDIRHRPCGCGFSDRCLYSDEACSAWKLENTYTSGHVVRCKNIAEIPRYTIRGDDDETKDHS